jgi:hypothetical protein
MKSNHRLHVHRRRKGERLSLSEADYAHLIAAAHSVAIAAGTDLRINPVSRVFGRGVRAHGTRMTATRRCSGVRALLADGQEVIGEQCVEPVGVAALLGVRGRHRAYVKSP